MPHERGWPSLVFQYSFGSLSRSALMFCKFFIQLLESDPKNLLDIKKISNDEKGLDGKNYICIPWEFSGREYGMSLQSRESINVPGCRVDIQAFCDRLPAGCRKMVIS